MLSRQKNLPFVVAVANSTAQKTPSFYGSMTPTVVGEGFLSRKRLALCKATRENNPIVRIK